MWDVVVVGAGPAGAAAALGALAAQPDARVLLLDRAAFPRDKSCGDGVAPHALDVLAELGVHDLVTDHRPVQRLRLGFADAEPVSGEHGALGVRRAARRAGRPDRGGRRRPGSRAAAAPGAAGAAVGRPGAARRLAVGAGGGRGGRRRLGRTSSGRRGRDPARPRRGGHPRLRAGGARPRGRAGDHLRPAGLAGVRLVLPGRGRPRQRGLRGGPRERPDQPGAPAGQGSTSCCPRRRPAARPGGRTTSRCPAGGRASPTGGCCSPATPCRW